MSKGLEALKNIKINCCTFEDRTLYQNEFNIIENELKALEIIIEMINNDKIVDRLNANSQKIIKALFNDLSKEKQDLLKEVLL